LLLKYVVTPLLIIVGALVGVKLALPWKKKHINFFQLYFFGWKVVALFEEN
jgi:hypothetical protein